MTTSRTIHQTQAMIDRYGRLNGDNDIIHYDPDYARRRGFRGTLNHGLMTLGYVAEVGAQRWGRDWFYGGELTLKWTDPVCPGDDLAVSADEDGAVTCEVQTGLVAEGRIGVSGDE